MSKIVRCPKCKGKGRIHDTALGISTCGITTLLECLDDNLKDECPKCGGSGFLKLK